MSEMMAPAASAKWLSAPEWNGGPLICCRIREETADVKTYTFQAPDAARFCFKPGQFITLAVDIDGQIHHRAYTIASSPSQPFSLELTVKAIPGGRVSNWLSDHLNVGDILEALAPQGAFNLFDIPAQKYLLLSAGSGITPMIAISRWLRDLHLDADIRFVHSARSAADRLFVEELEAMAREQPGFALSWMLSQGREGGSNSYGRLTLEMLAERVPDLHQRTVLICGPAPYMAAVRQMLEQVGFDMSRCFQESFGDLACAAEPGLADGEAETGESTSGAGAGHQLTVRGHDQVLQLEPGATVLDALERQGLPIIGACRAGICGACKCKLERGGVNATSQVGLSEAEIAAGVFLACSSTLTEDSEISL